MRVIVSASGIIVSLLLGSCVVAPVDYPPGDYRDYQADSPVQPVNYGGSVDEVDQPPPPIPDYDQPPCPVDGYLWTPGLWQWAAAGYYWVPGTWVAPPSFGLLWTPGYWSLSGPAYVFHPGYWGPHIGFYGGINYGHGYFGDGYAGGRWINNNFQYNRAVTNVNVTVVHNTYNQTVINNVDVTHITNANRVSYAGGAGTRLQPTPQERAVAHESHLPPTVMQIQHETAARGNPEQNAGRNVGRPPVAGAPRPGAFDAPGFTAARPNTPQYQPQVQPTARAFQPPEQAQHARDLPQPQGGNPQFELRARQEQERQTLALQQEQEHRAFANQPNHGPQEYRAMEQQHQQQSQQMQQRHQQERRN